MTLKTITVIETKFNIVESNRRSPEEAREWPQIIAILIATISALTSGILFSWASPSIPILISADYPGDITLAAASYLTVLPPVTAALTSPMFAVLTDRIGRKLCLIIFTTVPHISAWLLVILGEGRIDVLYASRLFAGVADSCIFAVLPTYIAEVATPKVRGTWGNAMTVSIFSGQFIINAIGAFFSIKLTAYILIPIPIVFLLLFSLMPETPYFLIMKKRNEKAKESLRWLRHKYNVDEELESLTKDVNRQLSEPGTVKDLFMIPSNRKAIFIGAISRLCQQYCGISAFVTYTKYLFESAGGEVSTTASSLIFSGLMIVTNFLSAFVLDKIGRKMAMTISSLGCCVSLVSLSVFIYLKDYTNVDLSAISWFPIFGMVCFVIAISVGLSIVPNMLLGELFSSSIKGKALCLMNICFALYVASSTKLFQVLLSTYGLYVPFAFYATCCLVSSVVSYFVIPETTGKTLEEIQQQFKAKK